MSTGTAPAAPASTEPAAAPAAPPADPPDDPARHMVPRSRLNDVEKARREAEARVKELEEAEQRRVDAERTQVERLQAEAEKERKLREAAEARVTTMERSTFLRDAAIAAGVPVDRMKAVTKLADLDECTDESSAAEHVKTLLEESPFLLPAEGDPTPTPPAPRKVGGPAPRDDGAPPPQSDDPQEARRAMGKVVASLFGSS